MSDSAPSANAPADKRSKVERAKEASGYLQGSIAEELANDKTNFSEDAYHILKFHGIYEQDDRDLRTERRRAGLEPRYQFMIRTAIPGGVLTAPQYLVLDRLAGEVANDTLRVTTRQNIQYHGVLKGDLKDLVRTVNDALVTTLTGCGDVERNVVGCPAPQRDRAHEHMLATCRALAERLRPQSPAYYEVWLREDRGDQPGGDAEAAPAEGDRGMNGAKVFTSEEDVEPLYGKTYLPRKFKTSIAFAHDNCVDVYAQDIGLVLLTDPRGDLEGFNIIVGGGLGMSHGKKDTFPRLGDAIAFAQPWEVVDVVEHVVRIQRDHGNREDRSHARMKYLVHAWGPERFKEVLEERLARRLAPPRPLPRLGFDDHVGWHEQGDSKMFLGVFVENGRIGDTTSLRLRTALRDIVARFEPEVRLTATQNVLLANLRSADRAEVQRILRDAGYRGPEALPLVRRFAMACPALPTCGVAITESERAMPAVLDRVEAVVAELGLQDEALSVRMTGCPNGCARPYVADIGFVGQSANKYAIFAGGGAHGERLASKVADLVPVEGLPAVVHALLLEFREHRREGEPFGDYCARVGEEQLRALVSAGRAAPT